MLCLVYHAMAGAHVHIQVSDCLHAIGLSISKDEVLTGIGRRGRRGWSMWDCRGGMGRGRVRPIGGLSWEQAGTWEACGLRGAHCGG